ncbi:hypothetical protein VTP01DRAFT_7006 [Rhizomucor pusillus]|uniref:uncharacterized protein n=1 Tax=Rhizomucor pusillus TaxID=4840 RepID=UPI003742E7BD
MALSSYASFSISTIGFISNLLALYSVHYVYENPYAVGFGGHFQYLTILGLSTATLAFAVKMYRFFVPGGLQGFYEVVTNIATPLEGLVSVMYWAMVFIDPELLIPKDMPPIPNIVDFALHLYPAMFLWSDFLIFNADFKRSPRHVALIYACAALYLAWSWYCQTKNGYWPYPFLDQLDTVPRVLFYLFCGTLCWIIYEAGAFVHSCIHAQVKSRETAKKLQ